MDGVRCTYSQWADAGGGEESDTSLKAEPDEDSQIKGLFKLLLAG